MEPIRTQLVYHLPASPERLWPILSDTDRLNRRLGLPPTVVQPEGDDPIRLLRVKAALHGLNVEWLEEPFEFVEGQRFWVRRVLVKGPLREFNAGLTLRAAPTGSDVIVQSELIPNNAAGLWIIRALVRKLTADWNRLIEQVNAHLQGQAATALGPGIDETLPAAHQAVESRLREVDLAALPGPLAPLLLNYLASAPDHELTRIRPAALARKWGGDRYEVLYLCLRAVKAGILNLSWDMLCPNCRGASSRWTRLSDVQEQSHCDDCRITYDASFDRSVEVTFRPNSRYRTVDSRIFCSAGPRNTPHIFAQEVLDPGESVTWTFQPGPGRYRLRDLPGSRGAWIVVDQDCNEDRLEARIEPDELVLKPDAGFLGPGLVELVVVNKTGARVQIIFERVGSYEDVMTAAEVTAQQEFRDLFGSEVLSPNTQLAIETLPLMFTDLKGSTDLYSLLGDASAYALVRDHFALLHDLVARYHGGVIKTIGDAVMAAFPTASDAVGCALQMNQDLVEFNRTASQPLRLKIGLHQGPCIAVRSYDERLDYFGTTVNLAARVGEESHGADVVVTRAILADPASAALIASHSCTPFTAILRGIGPVELVKVEAP